MKRAPLTHIELIETQRTGTLPGFDDPVKWTPWCDTCAHFIAKANWCQQHQEATAPDHNSEGTCKQYQNE